MISLFSSIWALFHRSRPLFDVEKEDEKTVTFGYFSLNVVYASTGDQRLQVNTRIHHIPWDLADIGSHGW